MEGNPAMRKLIVAALFFTALFFSPTKEIAASEEVLPPAEESEAFRQYLRRPRIELAKLIYLMDRFRSSDFEVIYDGNTYDVGTAVNYAKGYIAEHHKRDEKADHWVKVHAYRSDPGGKIIYAKASNGKRYIVRDLLLKELEILNQLAGKYEAS
jgi:hypothetical protein